ncbi:uncharacterized protein EV420DRAFT_1644796 [Desarmillaria tabescens]|uniref:Uncharacterized protein n=1 Tax=Armillaria tabescens TaxID=1929756 RepID=A0AA39K737_ARMTA|nr:uncharacterized protein EV420DRAFT_1644796 [Desarmillaria tabescens]KAK0455577.1 hypothetical protein EV420DRAFT_1644796 [Desarmillaria tabescens]
MMRKQHFETDVEEYRNKKRHELQTFKTHNTRGSSGLVTRPQWIIAFDSENIVLGMTEWLPKWKTKRTRVFKGKLWPANLDN